MATLAALWAAACQGPSAPSVVPAGSRETPRVASPADASDRLDPEAHYRAYLARYGWTQPGNRVMELGVLALGEVRFFALEDGGRRLHARFKAAATRAGVVTPGEHPEDDWLGLLSATNDPMVLAERIAWLETDDSVPGPHVLVPVTWAALSPRRPTAGSVDPAEIALVTEPVLKRSAGGGATLVAWLQHGLSIQRWTVTARPDMPAVIVTESAADLLAATGDGPAAKAARARHLLASGTADERSWALFHLKQTSDRAALPDVAALLANASADPGSRLLAAGTLGSLGDQAAVAPLGAALRADPAIEVRVSCAQTLGRIRGATGVRALSDALPAEREVRVRIEIVHALAEQGIPETRAVLDRVARDDPDADVRKLASIYRDRLR
jgi:hypothetical protein